MAVDIACCVGTGHAWHGHQVTQGGVLYIVAEGAHGLGPRVDAWALAPGIPVTGVTFLPVAVQLMAPVELSAVTQLIHETRPALVVLDTQARVTLGAEENSSKDMGRYVDALEQLRQASQACVLSVHHQPRNGEHLRGSTALEGAATTILQTMKDGDAVTVTNPKQKDGPEVTPLKLALAAVGGSVILSHEAVGILGFATDSEHAVLTVLRDSFGTRGATKTELREAADQPKSTWYRSINALVSKGLVLERKEGRSTFYTLPGDNQQAEIPTSPKQSHG